MGIIYTLSVGKEKPYNYKNKEYISAIGKRMVDKCFLSVNGFEGDGVANPAFHGGPERAVCYYPFEHYEKWEMEFQTKIAPPAFGENICGTEFVEKNTYIGDVFSIGDAIVQVTQGRIPCSTISSYNRIDPFLKRVMETCYTGYFLKVIEEGMITSDAQMTLLERKQSEISVWEATRVMLLDRKNKEMMGKIIELEGLAKDWQNRFEKALKKY